jgi:beta-fructofuranosidase
MEERNTATWLFDTERLSQASLDAGTPKADFTVPANEANTFTIICTVDLAKFNSEKHILEIPDVVSVILRQHDPADRERQNYPSFPLSDGSVPVLEATITLHSIEHPDWQRMTIGIPLGMLDNPDGEHAVILDFTGTRWTMYVDGEVLDNDFPFGYPRWGVQNSWKLDRTYVESAALYRPGIVPQRREPQKANLAPCIQYWTPPGHNSWVGDVATIFHEGRYHLFYLYDRRHHQSKFGCGAHYFEHISTTDFRTWIEHEAATPLEEQWECIGTGTPFTLGNKLCIGYGLHTTRVYPRRKTTLPAQWEYLDGRGHTGSFKSSTTPGVPAGSTYAVSSDGGSHFEKTGIMFHPCENPSVYTDPAGALRLLANSGSNGMWKSKSANGGWRCVNQGFPPGGDCTFFFRWGRFDYIIGGFTGLWSKSADAPDSTYTDVVGKGLDFYDGGNVPSIAEIPGGRFVMASWIPIHGWGGNLIIRELMQYSDGRIGSKWMEEVTPKTERPETLAKRVDDVAIFSTEDRSYMLIFDAQPANAMRGSFAVSFSSESDEEVACELQICIDNQRAQFGPASRSAFADREKSLREGGAPHRAGNYAIENLIGVDRPFTVRVIVMGHDKIGGMLIDVEIAGQRTMISYRPELTMAEMVFRAKGVELSNVRIAPLESNGLG